MLDIMMPKMDGHSVNLKLKEHAETSKIPVIIITGRGQLKELIQARQEISICSLPGKTFYGINAVGKDKGSTWEKTKQNETPRLRLALLFFSVSCSYAWFEQPTAGQPGGYLSELSGGARGMALGLAQVSLDGQANLLYSNPGKHREPMVERSEF